MFYPFPQDLTLAEVRETIRVHNEKLGVAAFIEADRGDHVIFNYIVAFAGSFPQPDTGDALTDRQYAILRECRGLIMCSTTGKVLARRFQKFFNVNEKDFTQAHLIDWSQPHRILDKLDGSMITPVLTGGAIRGATKRGLTDQAAQVENFVRALPKYEQFARAMMKLDQTPIFEWTSRQQRIVIDYPEDQLILTAVRSNKTGAYATFDMMQEHSIVWDIPLVKCLTHGISDINAFIEHTRGLKNAEGYVIRFDNGHMVKIKAEEYCRIHSTQDALRNEKDVWSLVLNDQIDDMLPFILPVDRSRLDNFVQAFDLAILARADSLRSQCAIIRCLTDGSKKGFAAAIMALPPEETPKLVKSMLFSIFDGRDPVDVVRAVLLKNVSTSTKVEEVRFLVGGIQWRDFYGDPVEE
jgi:RNA ligase